MMTGIQAIPEQIALTYSNIPTEMVVSWADTTAADTTTTEAECIYGISPDNLDSKVIGYGITYSKDDYISPYLFNATLIGLNSGNIQYYYKVGSITSGYSELYSFKSHPGIGPTSIGTQTVTFHIVGDLGQTNNTIHTLEEVLMNEHEMNGLSGGIINMGDLSYANGNQTKWDTFGNFRQFISSEIPMMTTLGNHEWMDDSDHQFIAYLSRFSNPSLSNNKRELYYSYNVGYVHFIMIAGYCSQMKSVYQRPNPCVDNSTAQLEWLQMDLKSIDRKITPWIIVIFHQPYVNSNFKHNMRTEGHSMEDDVEDTLYTYGVDLVLSGHVHAYERSCRVYKYECVDNAPYYITIGDGGNAEGLSTHWLHPQPEWSLYRQASYGHGELIVFNTTHMSWKWHQNQDLSPIVTDQFWIIKEDNSLQQIKGITKYPEFANTVRGILAAIFNKAMQEKYEQDHNNEE
jgi:Icc-related predicted phosphoesterase